MKKSNKDNLLNKVPFYPVTPHGYVSTSELADRTGGYRTDVLNKIKNGTIPIEYVISTQPKKAGGKRQFALFWNKAAYAYIISRRPTSWPEDFQPNDDETYNPIEMIDEQVLNDDDDDDDTDDSEQPAPKIKYKSVKNIADAKLRVEQLKIAKMQAELRLANNEVIPMRDVINHDKELATKLKGVITRAINTAAPLVAATSSVNNCRSILEGQFREAIETINPLNREEKEQ